LIQSHEFWELQRSSHLSEINGFSTGRIALINLIWFFLMTSSVVHATFELACDRLQAVLNRMREANLKLKPTKHELFQSSVRFLGSIVGRDGISADPEKIEVV